MGFHMMVVSQSARMNKDVSGFNIKSQYNSAKRKKMGVKRQRFRKVELILITSKDTNQLTVEMLVQLLYKI